MLTPTEKRNYFKELALSDIFKAQTELEQDVMSDLTRRISELDVKHPAFSLEYAKFQGGMDIIRQLQGARKLLINSAFTPAVKKEHM